VLRGQLEAHERCGKAAMGTAMPCPTQRGLPVPLQLAWVHVCGALVKLKKSLLGILKEHMIFDATNTYSYEN